jgi:putative endonuclease
MAYNKRDVGGQKETLAVLFLEKQGFRILDRNYYTRHGELDIVAMDGEYLVFAEVKYRRDSDYGTPAQAVIARKQRHLQYAARTYLYEKKLDFDSPIRFDVIEISGEEINIIKNAF